MKHIIVKKVAVMKKMGENSDFGACDSEPLYHLEVLLDETFGRTERW